MRKVSLVKGNNRRENIKKSLELIKDDILLSLKDKKSILIKPNLTALKDFPMANTDKAVVDEIISFLNANFDSLTIVLSEASGSAFYNNISTRQVFEDFGYFELVEKYNNVTIEHMEQYSNFFKVKVKTCHDEGFVEVASRVNDFDAIISVGIPKMHNYALATFGIKNMMGMVKSECMSRIHGLRTFDSNGPSVFNHIPTSIISRMRRLFPGLTDWLVTRSGEYKKGVKIIHDNIFQVIGRMYPDIVVLDGYYSMEGSGPVDGKGVKTEFAIASTDALKADALGARCIGLDPDRIPYMNLFKDRGDSSLEGLCGEKVETVQRRLKRHPAFHIQDKYSKI